MSLVKQQEHLPGSCLSVPFMGICYSGLHIQVLTSHMHVHVNMHAVRSGLGYCKHRHITLNQLSTPSKHRQQSICGQLSIKASSWAESLAAQSKLSDALSFLTHGCLPPYLHIIWNTHSIPWVRVVFDKMHGICIVVADLNTPSFTIFPSLIVFFFTQIPLNACPKNDTVLPSLYVLNKLVVFKPFILTMCHCKIGNTWENCGWRHRS